jgi:Curlin associated repeat
VNGTQTGGSNTAIVGQFGNFNSATYFQNGAGNTITIMQGIKH